MKSMILAVGIFSLIFSCAEDEETTALTCKTTEYIIENDIEPHTGRFYYDDQGRVIKDSVVGEPQKTRVFTYIGNQASIVQDGYTEAVVTMNSNGMPLESTYGGIVATYKASGELEKVTAASLPEPDSIIYADGNIVSYIIYGVYRDTRYTCTYYTDKEYREFNPTFRLDPFFPFLSQVFSKNLLKSYSYTDGIDGRTENYAYEFDENGNVIHITAAVSIIQGGDYVFDDVYKHECQ